VKGEVLGDVSNNTGAQNSVQTNALGLCEERKLLETNLLVAL